MSAEPADTQSALDRDKIGLLDMEGTWLPGWLRGVWNRSSIEMRKALLNNIQLDYRALDDEIVLFVVHMAPYRMLVPETVMERMPLLLLGWVLSGLSVYLLGWAQGLSWLAYLAAFPLLVLLAAWFWALKEWLVHHQWRVVITNRRTIIGMPWHRSGLIPLIDQVQIQGITVVDTSWSRNPFWRLFQIKDDARDLVLSIAGYEFKEESAEVKGGLRMPDVLMSDIRHLQEFIFPKS